MVPTKIISSQVKILYKAIILRRETFDFTPDYQRII